MSTPLERLKLWARPRAWSIAGGLAPLVLALVAFGFAADDWLLAAGGFVGLLFGAVGVVVLVMYPVLWEPANRARFFVWFVAIGTAVVVSIVAIVFLLT